MCYKCVCYTKSYQEYMYIIPSIYKKRNDEISRNKKTVL